jgi:MFS family permease
MDRPAEWAEVIREAAHKADWYGQITSDQPAKLYVVSDLNGLDLYTWPIISYLLCTTIAMPLVGKLIDSIGAKAIYLFGIVAFLIGSVLCGLAHDMIVCLPIGASKALAGQFSYPMRS